MDKTVIIQNPPVFLTTSYVEKNALKDDFETGSVNVIEKFGCPYKVLITFDDSETANKFIDEYNGKSFEVNQI
ncbi:MAG: hypothetical protein MJ252_29270 [archaeon]|nr:hypothetical protein [archaeon]